MDNKAIDILKQAIIMENRGKSLYQMVVAQTPSAEVKNIFQTMADEEQMHIEFLTKQFAHYNQNKSFDLNQLKSIQSEENIANQILT